MSQMCANSECERYGEQVRVLGGCDVCLEPLVRWRDPNVPTIEQIAYIVQDVARLEGRPVPRDEIERILRNSLSIHKQWLDRLLTVDWKARLNELAVLDAAPTNTQGD